MTSLPRHALLALAIGLIEPTFAADDAAKRSANLVILDPSAAKNLQIETVEVEETDFEETVFALGNVDALPDRIAAVSSRISGRIVELKAIPGDTVKKDQEVAKIESRQPGDPPPVISLKAPIGGLITRLEARLGDPLEPEKALLEIMDLSEVYAIACVPEHYAGRMKPGTIAHITVAALPGQKFDGELLRFGTSAEKESGTIDAVFRMPNPGGLLRAGMRAEFSIVLSKRSNVVSVPRAALQGDAMSRFVYVRDFELPNAFLKAPVQVGQINDRFVEITGGLFPADEVVTRGAYSLSFANASGISLKEALDAAHGHEHAADGSELTDAQRAKLHAAESGTKGEAPASGAMATFWMFSTLVLLTVLVVGRFLKKPADS